VDTKINTHWEQNAKQNENQQQNNEIVIQETHQKSYYQEQKLNQNNRNSKVVEKTTPAAARADLNNKQRVSAREDLEVALVVVAWAKRADLAMNLLTGRGVRWRKEIILKG
jgi:hypothetical protein